MIGKSHDKEKKRKCQLFQFKMAEFATLDKICHILSIVFDFDVQLRLTKHFFVYISSTQNSKATIVYFINLIYSVVWRIDKDFKSFNGNRNPYS